MKTRKRVRNTVIAMGLAFVFGGLVVHAETAKPARTSAQADRMADRLTQMMPFARSQKDGEDAGKSVGERLVGQLMIDAMATCAVPTSVLFES